MTLRVIALSLALLLGSSPIATVICTMQCSERPVQPACHTSMGLSGGHELRGAEHSCDHDHGSADPATLTSSATRSLTGSVVAFSTAVAAHLPIRDGGSFLAHAHGPPGAIDSDISPRVTVLRI